jgi:hypothetical protein
MSKESLKLLESMRHHSWKYRLTLDEGWLYLSTDHESVWFSLEDETPQRESRLGRSCSRSSGIHTDFTWLMSNQRAANFTLVIISLTFPRPCLKFLLRIKMTQGDILWFTLTMPDFIVPKRLLCFWS